MSRHYFDYNASAPLRPEAAAAMVQALCEVGNPSSPHYEGQRARLRVEEARRAVAELVGAQPTEVVFTGSGTEAINLALLGSVRALAGARDRVLLSAIEHDAAQAAGAALAEEGCHVLPIGVDRDGRLRLDLLEAALDERTAAVAVMAANNETGVIQPLAEARALTRRHGAHLIVDAVQAAGKIAIDFRRLGADFVAISAHKLGGPHGIGALIRRRSVPLQPIIHGGGQEQGYRSGTENVAAIAGFGAAASASASDLATETMRCRELRDALERELLEALPEARVNGADTERLPNTTSITIPGIDAGAAVVRLDRMGFALSTGSACTSGAAEPSHVLAAMGITPAEARATLRISIGWRTSPAEVTLLVEAVKSTVAMRRRELAS